MAKRLRALTLMLALALSPVAPVVAQDAVITSKAQAAKVARSAVSGRVLRIDKIGQVYRVKVLKKSGRVVSVDVNVYSGKATTRQSGN